jgi:tRNA 2-thiouridine synthesizing protein A
MVSVRYIVRSLRNSDDTGSTEGRIVAEKILNLRGLKCPLPALRVRKALTGLKTGDMLIAECTDPLTAIDIPNLLRETGDTMVSTGREGEVLIFRIRKS